MKMSRRKIRETIFLMLFRIEFNTKEELLEQVDWFFEQRVPETEEDEYLPNPDLEEADEKYIRDKLNQILDHLEELDDTILHICSGWKLSRIGKAELGILRLAVYEIRLDEEIPTGVAINEAVELAKVYSSEEAPRFVNGVLAKLT